MRKINTCAELEIRWEWHIPAPLKLPGFKRALKQAWREKFGDVCSRCNKRMQFDVPRRSRVLKTYATVDHIRPKSKGGTDALSNPMIICSQCNNRKGDRHVSVFPRVHLNQTP